MNTLASNKLLMDFLRENLDKLPTDDILQLLYKTGIGMLGKTFWDKLPMDIYQVLFKYFSTAKEFDIVSKLSKRSNLMAYRFIDFDFAKNDKKISSKKKWTSIQI